MKTRKEMVINNDVTMTLQLAEVTITTNRGTRKADDELCITLREKMNGAKGKLYSVRSLAERHHVNPSKVQALAKMLRKA